MRKGLGELLVVAALAPACGGGALQPDGVTSGRGGAGAGSAAGAGTGGIGGTAGAAGSTGPSSCPQITVAPGVLNPCGRTYSVAFSPDGRLLATGTEGARPNVHLWRLSDGGHVRDTDGAGMTTYHVEFSPDGTLLATAGGYTETGGALDTLPEIVKLFNVADGSLVRTIPARCGSYASTAAFSHDGALLATAGEQGPVEVWRVAAGTLVASIGYPTTVDNVRFSPDDTKVLVGGVDRRTTVWSLPDGALMMTLDGTGDEMADASYSPDGSEIISTGREQRARAVGRHHRRRSPDAPGAHGVRQPCDLERTQSPAVERLERYREVLVARRRPATSSCRAGGRPAANRSGWRCRPTASYSSRAAPMARPASKASSSFRFSARDMRVLALPRYGR